MTDEGLVARAERVQLLVLDVDGVLTDGRLYFTADGEAMKVFDVTDGLGLKAVLDAGIRVALISGRGSPIVENRAAELGIDLLRQGIGNKSAALDEILAETGIPEDALAVMGDDLPDLPMLRRATLSSAPADARPEVREACHWVASVGGGRGAVRALCDLLLAARKTPTRTPAAG